jgi:hypothetical protein
MGKKLNASTQNPKSYAQLTQKLSMAIQVGNAASVMGTMPQHSRDKLDHCPLPQFPLPRVTFYVTMLILFQMYNFVMTVVIS